MLDIKFMIEKHHVDIAKLMVKDMAVNGYVRENISGIWYKNRYIQIILDGFSDCVHFEFWQDHWALHLESVENDEKAEKLLKYLENYQFKDNFLCRKFDFGVELRVKENVENLEDFVYQFRRIYSELIPCIESVRLTPSIKVNSNEASIKLIEDIFNNNLRIPDYQRPYVWETSNVLQLLNDLNTSRLAQKSHYRIGSLILHFDKEKKCLNIVDGQQRITTLLLIFKACIENPENYHSVTGCIKNITELEINFQKLLSRVLINTKEILKNSDENKRKARLSPSIAKLIDEGILKNEL